MTMDMDDHMDMGDPMDVDEEDDEETLQLKLQQIQAQLRLKKLRKDKARSQNDPHSSFSQHSDQDNTKGSRPGSASTARAGLRIKEIRRTDAAARPPSQDSGVEVPASPVRKVQQQPEQTSPSRILLGIDKGLRGKDISLKRAPSLRKSQDDLGGSQSGAGYLQRSRTPGLTEGKPRPLSFNERLSAARTEEKTREETRSKASRSRSSAFNVTQQEMEDYKKAAVDVPPNEPSPHDRIFVFARDDTAGTAPSERPRNGHLHRSNTAPDIRATSRLGHGAANSGSFSSQVAGSFSSIASDTPKSPSASFDVYSGFHLSKRILPHPVVARAVSGKTAYSIKDLLRQVKAPDWSLPDDVVDSVVFAIVASKSDPRHHKPQYDAETGKMKQSDRGKYMVLTLVDLQYEVELFLFNTGFERFWKLSTGTVVAILNPDLMPPPPGRADTGRFSLTINSDADTILEIGAARDLGYCKSVKADGKLCNSWVNARRTEHCEFHTNTALSRTRSARQEINGTAGLGNGSKGHRSQDWSWKESAEAKRRSKVEEEHGRLDWETRSRYFMSGGSRGQSASSLIDRDGIADTRARAEGLKRKLAAQEKERDIAKQLGEMGSGSMGGEYMRISGAQPTTAGETSRTGSRAASRLNGTRGPRTVPSSSTFKPEVRLPAGISLPHTDDQDQPRKTDARSLGLLAPRGTTGAPKISLSPIKRKRQDSTLSSNSSFDSKPPAVASPHVTTASSRLSAATGRPPGGFGWGTSLRDKLSRMRAGERLSLHTSNNSVSTTASSSGASSSSGGAGATATTTTTVTGGSAFRDKDRSPVRKKTRFVTEKGIREAGRESLPGSVVADHHSGQASRAWNGQLASRRRQQQEVVLEGDDDDDDDDELLVVR
jgi:minichromosome maintenance protein 10